MSARTEPPLDGVVAADLAHAYADPLCTRQLHCVALPQGELVAELAAEGLFR